MNHLMLLDENQAKAVETRQELDLRTGAALTRFLTINFKQRLSEVMKDKLISYGSCQFPTLGFVVEQYLKIQNFKAEEFWKIQLNVKKEKMIVDFSWHRGSIFDPLLATIIYERLVNNPEAIIKTVNTSPTSQR